MKNHAVQGWAPATQISIREASHGVTIFRLRPAWRWWPCRWGGRDPLKKSVVHTALPARAVEPRPRLYPHNDDAIINMQGNCRNRLSMERSDGVGDNEESRV